MYVGGLDGKSGKSTTSTKESKYSKGNWARGENVVKYAPEKYPDISVSVWT